MSTHIVSDLEKVADYVTLLHQGKIFFSENKDELLELHAVLKCSTQEFAAIDPAAVKGHRTNSFGVEALVLRDHFPESQTLDRASLEDIMLYTIRREKAV